MTDTTANASQAQGQTQAQAQGSNFNGGNTGNSDAQGAPPSESPDNSGAPAPRVHKTHLPGLVDHLKSLSLRSKLDLNVDIENRNRACKIHRLDKLRDPVAHPEPDSDVESVISISEDDWLHIVDSTTFESYSSSLPIFVREELAQRKRSLKDLEDDSADSHKGMSENPRKTHNGRYVSIIPDCQHFGYSVSLETFL